MKSGKFTLSTLRSISEPFALAIAQEPILEHRLQFFTSDRFGNIDIHPTGRSFLHIAFGDIGCQETIGM